MVAEMYRSTSSGVLGLCSFLSIIKIRDIPLRGPAATPRDLWCNIVLQDSSLNIPWYIMLRV
jgi:hypothetical protein